MRNKKGTAVRSKHSGSFLRRVSHQRRQHQCAQGQGDDAEQGGEDHASGRELLIVAELNGEHRGDRSGRAALQQQHHLCAHAEAQQTQRRKGRQTQPG